MTGLLRSMDRAGIARSVVCPIATAPKHVEAITAWSAGVRSERILPLGSIHPEHEDMPGAVRRIARSGLLGVKLHPLYQRFAFDDRRMWPAYRAVAECGLMLMLHCGRDFASDPNDDSAAPHRVLEVHRAFPDIPIVCTHMGGWKMWDEVLETLTGAEVYFETSYSLDFCPPQTLRAILDRHSPERIVFGTDSPWRDQGAMLELVRATFPEEAVRRKVLVENAERLLAEVAERVG